MTKKAQLRETRKANIKYFFNNMFMYLLTVLGMFVARYKQAYVAKEKIIIDIDPVNILLTCIFAMGMLGVSEHVGTKNPMGKNKNTWKRAYQAVCYGLAAYAAFGG